MKNTSNRNLWIIILIFVVFFLLLGGTFVLEYSLYNINTNKSNMNQEDTGTTVSGNSNQSTEEEQLNNEESKQSTNNSFGIIYSVDPVGSTVEKEVETVEYIMDVKVVEDNKEVWEEYTVDLIEARESQGVYKIANSKTDGYTIQIKYNDNGKVDFTEYNEYDEKVRYLGTALDCILRIKDYNEITED